MYMTVEEKGDHWTFYLFTCFCFYRPTFQVYARYTCEYRYMLHMYKQVYVASIYMLTVMVILTFKTHMLFPLWPRTTYMYFVFHAHPESAKVPNAGFLYTVIYAPCTLHLHVHVGICMHILFDALINKMYVSLCSCSGCSKLPCTDVLY